MFVYFSTNLTIGLGNKDLHSTVRSGRPVVVPIECPRPKTMVHHCPPKLKVIEPPLSFKEVRGREIYRVSVAERRNRKA